MNTFTQRLARLTARHEELLTRPNAVDLDWDNGIYQRYRFPVVTAAHTPLTWRYDLDPITNPYLMERIGINGAFNAGAIELDGKTLLMVRVEGWDRKSFFAVAESDNGVDNFRFWDEPVVMPETDDPDTKFYPRRLYRTPHQQCTHGLFCQLLQSGSGT